jgi:alanyl-tRNA synthetase
MTSTQIRQSFLNFFKSKQHTIVPSDSVGYQSRDGAKIFTNAGMNQFVPIFLGERKADVDKWAGVIPGMPTRAADTQKCIRAGGKHNDLDDVGLDTYHHTFFEMLGNWSFGDYFKKEAIEWAWELVFKVWKFPAQRLYATVFCPYLGEPGWEQKWAIELEQVIALTMTSAHYIAPNPNASPFEVSDQEAAMYWAQKFTAAGCDPKVHIIPGNKKDNFWMMGETGPCGPCTEIHVDLTPDGNTRGSLVNKGDARCIEIWNNVFIQFNANPDGTFVLLPAKHVDTGMGFERVTSIIQGTKGLTDFKNAKISNYETDIFRPIFEQIEKQTAANGTPKRYASTLPKTGSTGDTEQEKIDVAFRVIADHIRTLSFAIADGIQPGNTDRNYVLRRILRRAVRYGRTLGFHEPFFYKLVDVLAVTMGDMFPEIRAKKNHVQDVIRIEEEAFNKTLDRGIELFESILQTRKGLKAVAAECRDIITGLQDKVRSLPDNYSAGQRFLPEIEPEVMQLGQLTKSFRPDSPVTAVCSLSSCSVFLTTLFTVDDEKSYLTLIKVLPEYVARAKDDLSNDHLISDQLVGGKEAFVLYDTYGFPLDLTELMARERGLTVDNEGFEKLMEEQRNRARAAQKKEVISLSQIETTTSTKFVGYDDLSVQAKVVEVVSLKDKTAVILDASACYAEMGGQVGDAGAIYPASVAADVSRLKPSDGADSRPLLHVTNTQKSGNTWLHIVESGKEGVVTLPEIGSTVTIAVDVNRRNAIQRHHTVTHLLHWALHEVASKEASQKGSFVGPDKLTFDFNSAPLTPAQIADIEKLVNERILENSGVSWTEVLHNDVKGRKDVMQFFGEKYGDTVRVVQIGGEAGQLNGYSMELCGGTHTRATGEIGLFRIVSEAAVAAGVRRIEAVAGLTAYDVMKHDRELIKSVAGKINSPIHELEKKIESLLAQQKALEKEVQIALQRNASNAASELLPSAQTVNGIPLITHNLGNANGDFLQAIADALKGRFKGVVVLGGGSESAVTLIATVSAEYTAKVQAGKIIQTIAPIVGGKGGGKPDQARGGGKDANKLDEALAKAKSLLG